jgi:PKD repeat protein
LNIVTTASIFENIEFVAQSNGTITWDLGDGTIVTGETVQHSYTQPGIYTITSIAVNGNCVQVKNSEIAIRTDEATNIAALNSAEMLVYPNPSNGNINLSGNWINDGGKFTVSIIDLSGRVVSSEEKSLVSGNSVNLNYGNIAEGIYQLQISGNSGVYSTKLIIKK